MESDTLRTLIAREVKRAVSDGGKSVRAYAKAMGVGHETVYRWMRGEIVPPLHRLEELAAATGQPITLHFGPEHRSTAPAWWAGAAESLVLQIEERMMPKGGLAVPDELVRQIARDLADELGLSEPLDAGAADEESPAPRDAAHRAAKRQR